MFLCDVDHYKGRAVTSSLPAWLYLSASWGVRTGLHWLHLKEKVCCQWDLLFFGASLSHQSRLFKSGTMCQQHPRCFGGLARQQTAGSLHLPPQGQRGRGRCGQQIQTDTFFMPSARPRPSRLKQGYLPSLKKYLFWCPAWPYNNWGPESDRHFFKLSKPYNNICYVLL